MASLKANLASALQYASSSSGGESSCEEGRIRRPPHLRPFHPRTIALDPDLPAMLSDPDYSSSSEQSCDTVIYVGPGGAAISDRELSDNEGPPAFVPIIPSLNKKRSVKEGSLDRDHFFKCNTFAELQERLECIDGSEEPTAFVGEAKRSQTSPKTDKSKECQGSVSPKTAANTISHSQEGVPPKQLPKSVATQPSCSPVTTSRLDNAKLPAPLADSVQSVCRTSADGEKSLSAERPDSVSKPNSEPVVREKVYFNKKSLPKPAPPPSQQRHANTGNAENEERSSTRMPPVGMSHQVVKRREPFSSPSLRAPVEVCQVRSTLRERCLDRDILRATVTLQQPVELNGEDELVFTVVEELSIGSLQDKGRPSSIISFNSDCSLQALASGSRPVSIISSINDEYDAYTSAVGGSVVNPAVATPPQDAAMSSVDSRGSSISSWLSEVSVCTLESDGALSTDVFLPPAKHVGPDTAFFFNSMDIFHCVPSPRDAKSSLNDSGFSFSEVDSDSAASSKLSLTKYPPSPESAKASLRYPSKISKAHSLSSSHLPQGPSIVHSSLPRKVKPTSSSSHSGSGSREPPRQESKAEDPWQRGTNHSEPQLSDSSCTSRFLRNPPSGISYTKTSNNSNSVPRPPKGQGSTSSQRVVDGCEKSASKNPPSKMPQLRRGATTLGTVPVIHSATEYKGAHDIISSTTSLKFSSLGKNNKANSQKPSSQPKPVCISPPPPPVRKSSLDQKTKNLLPQGALKSACGEAGKASGPRGAISEDELEVRHRADSIGFKTSSLNTAKVTSSLKGRGTRAELGQHYGSQVSLERCDSTSSCVSRAALSRENSGASLGSNGGKASKSIPRFGIPNSCSSPIATFPSSQSGGTLSRTGQAKAPANPRGLAAVSGSKARSLSANSYKGLSSSTKSLAAPVSRSSNANLPPSGRTATPRAATAAVTSKPGRGTIMGTKQAMRAANSRVSELAAGNIPGKHMRGSGDSDSGNDSGVNVSEDKSPAAALPSPYSKITAPRRPQRYSSGHGSDNSSVLSGELPPAMGRTALFYHSGGSSGYESMIRDSEATGSASSAHDSMSESGVSSSGRTRTCKYPKKRGNGELEGCFGQMWWVCV